VLKQKHYRQMVTAGNFSITDYIMSSIYISRRHK
jgi:hypothetical protein